MVWPLGAALAGVLAGQIGVRPALLVLTSVGIAAAGFAWASPPRRLAADARALAG
jgi:hypothetical protein